ncbi:MAG: Cna domain protein [Acidobacteriaceae bacterium]|nr:Cna domain protein [Acidobacteriaceae bacterium]
MASSRVSDVRKTLKLILIVGIAAIFSCAFSPSAKAQTTGSLSGHVFDPTGALIPGATLTLSQGERALTAQSGKEGLYTFTNVPTGAYTLTVTAEGFTTFSRADVALKSGQSLEVNVALKVAGEEQQVAVSDRNSGVGVDPSVNASAMVLIGKDLEALSDDPNEMLSQLQGLAGPGAGPNGGQIYIDGFTGGQLPPKSSIREIRINQNPFSAEFDRLGYGRIEIFTKPGTDKYHARVLENGSASAWNTSNPLVSQQPSYYLSFFSATLSGPLAKTSSFSLDVLRYDIHGQGIVSALNPSDGTSPLSLALPNPSSQTNIHSGLDFQLGSRNTLLIRDNYIRSVQSGAGVSALNLPQQAYTTNNQENAFQIADSVVVNSHLINETRFQWRRIRNEQTPSYFTPTVTLQGGFTTGGSNAGVVQDHQDIFEFQNYSTASSGNHTIRFGTRLRLYRDVNYSTSGANGNYLFNSVSQYLAKAPAQYQVAVIKNPIAQALLFDGALFFQDDWRWKPNLTVSYGLRLEGQNRIHNHTDWAPRLSLAWAPGSLGKTPPKTVLRAGYGWFYNRFLVPGSFSSITGTPYIIQAIHKNGVNQQSYVVNNPNFYDPTTQVPVSAVTSTSSSTPSFYSVDPNFHAALDMQGGIGIDRSVGKKLTFNITYLYTRGIHQYRTNNSSAPVFDPATYITIGPKPTSYNYQFQSGGVYKQHQLIFTADAHFQHVSLHGSYTLNHARSNTQGVTSFPSVAHNPGLDYGRPNFGISNSVVLIGTYSAPHGITFAPLLVAQSGVPYNVTIGSDLTGNNQFNARPTYGTCGAADVLSTPYGCLDTNPAGKGEKIIPFGLGTGPANVSFSMRVSKVLGVGPRVRTLTSAQGGGAGSVASRGLTGSGGSQPALDATAPHKYSLTFTAGAINLFNVVNLAPPNGTLLSPLFGKSQSLATGPYSNAVPGNRYVFLSTAFSF